MEQLFSNVIVGYRCCLPSRKELATNEDQLIPDSPLPRQMRSQMISNGRGRRLAAPIGSVLMAAGQRSWLLQMHWERRSVLSFWEINKDSFHFGNFLGLLNSICKLAIARMFTIYLPSDFAEKEEFRILHCSKLSPILSLTLKSIELSFIMSEAEPTC